ncbi:unnamed protein product [Spodoptera exigua]|uniref:Bublin coiled-coil protein n=1 Tax=Spodoptera exigua TaxID=7107 RepID=A0A835L4D9_SPOEX|nr:hypothetical protein HW555_007471 [Spodoptera exigua]CAH0700673.1 unnamed protein product [Spodoptera exigua]
MAGHDQNNCNQNGIAENNDIEPSEPSDESVVEEYIMLDSKLDELNSALDYLEQKNDDIHERLKELLQSNIEIRQELRNEKAEVSGNN